MADKWQKPGAQQLKNDKWLNGGHMAQIDKWWLNILRRDKNDNLWLNKHYMGIQPLFIQHYTFGDSSCLLEIRNF